MIKTTKTKEKAPELLASLKEASVFVEYLGEGDFWMLSDLRVKKGGTGYVPFDCVDDLVSRGIVKVHPVLSDGLFSNED